MNWHEVLLENILSLFLVKWVCMKKILSKEQYLDSYYQMLLVRRFEEKCGQLYGMSMISGFCHLYIGQEAVATGVSLAKQKGDSMITSYRDHAHIILAGIDP